MRTWTTLIVAAALAWAGWAAPARAQPACAVEQIHALIDETGARLRRLNADVEPRMRTRLRDLAQREGWTEADAESRGRGILEDDETRRLDDRAAELLAELDRLGDDSQSTAPVCERLERARTASAQLVEVTSARAAHMSARLDVALRPAAADPAPAPAPVPAARPEPRPDPKAAASAPRPAPAAPPPAARDVARPKSATGAPSWDTQTVREVQPSASAMPQAPAAPPPAEPGELGFTPEDIRAAGRGFFGSISAGLASVIDHAFSRFGKPTGYILGSEGGGAFLAGLRYGDGTLVTKAGGERRVYWQGPSVGFDFGLAGSRVMFLVYSVRDAEQLFARFAGIDGSAFVVGGVGITFLKKGDIILAPIRTGLGVRVGANVGYLKFTPTPSVNPF